MADLGLFAGVDSTGAIRFVADVSRGIACGCFCAGCGSPLVAKRGDVKIWHFAHEASQERPECLIGAANLLRRLAIEHIQTAQCIELPAYTEYVQAGKFPRIVKKQVAWIPQCRSISNWSYQPAQRGQVAQILTDSDVPIVLYVDVGSRPSARDPDAARGTGEIHFLIPLPEHGQLRALSDALEHISMAGHFRWIYLPDVTKQVEAAQEQVNIEPANLEREYEAGRFREEKVRQEILGLRKFSAPAPQVGFASMHTRLDNPRISDATPWATWRKPNSTFMFYGLRDRTSWMIITHQDGRLIAVPWPFFDGWDEALPERLGKADPALGGISLVHFEAMVSYLRDKQIAMHFSTTWQDILNLQWPPIR